MFFNKNSRAFFIFQRIAQLVYMERCVTCHVIPTVHQDVTCTRVYAMAHATLDGWDRRVIKVRHTYRRSLANVELDNRMR